MIKVYDPVKSTPCKNISLAIKASTAMVEYNEDFDTDALIEFLEEFPIRVLKVLKREKINGRSFLTLTDEELKKLDMKDDDRKELLKKINEVKETNKVKPEVYINIRC